MLGYQIKKNENMVYRNSKFFNKIAHK